MKKKTWSTLLSLIVTLSVLISYAGTVMADPADPEPGDTTAQTEQAGAEDPAGRSVRPPFWPAAWRTCAAQESVRRSPGPARQKESA